MSDMSESASNSLRTLSNDGIMSTCGMEYSLSSNCKGIRNGLNQLRKKKIDDDNRRETNTSSISNCSDSANRLSLEPRSDSSNDCNDGARSESIFASIHCNSNRFRYDNCKILIRRTQIFRMKFTWDFHSSHHYHHSLDTNNTNYNYNKYKHIPLLHCD